MNAFYASVELLAHPQLASSPVAVCGDPESRHGVILAKNEIAKSFGVATAETVWSARRKCPGLKLLKAHHQKYRDCCGRVNEIYCRFTDMVEAFSIDESWLDVTGSRRLFGDGREIGDAIRETVKAELGLTLSVGVSFNKVFAKMGSDYKKPDATTVISRGNYRELLWPLPAGELFGVGAATAAKLAAKGVGTIGGIAAYDRGALVTQFGKFGGMIHDYANGLDDSPVSHALERRRIKSIGNGATFRRDILGEAEVMAGVTSLADKVAGRMRKHGLKCGAVKVDIKDPGFKTITRQRQLDVPTNVTAEIIMAAMEIVRKNWDFKLPIRLITITAIGLADEGDAEQLSFLETGRPRIASLGARLKAERADKAVDDIRQRYGPGAIVMGNVLNTDIGLGVGPDLDEEPE
jgi:DNA polymerase-4